MSRAVMLYHGTLKKYLPQILRSGISVGEGWGGAGTSGVFLARTTDIALYWAKMGHQREHGELLEADRFDRKYGPKADRLIAVIGVEIPGNETSRLMADEEQFEEYQEQFEDVGGGIDPEDWKKSLEVIGAVRFEGRVPLDWLRQVILPSEIMRLAAARNKLKK